MKKCFILRSVFSLIFSIGAAVLLFLAHIKDFANFTTVLEGTVNALTKNLVLTILPAVALLLFIVSIVFAIIKKTVKPFIAGLLALLGGLVATLFIPVNKGVQVDGGVLNVYGLILAVMAFTLGFTLIVDSIRTPKECAKANHDCCKKHAISEEVTEEEKEVVAQELEAVKEVKEVTPVAVTEEQQVEEQQVIEQPQTKTNEVEKVVATNKPAPKKAPVKPAPGKPFVKKAAPKATAKAAPVAAKPAPKAAPVKPAAKPAAEPTGDKKVYHVAKRAEDNKWTVKFRGGKKVIKLFDTKKEAEEYVAVMAENQGATALVHNSKGKNKGRIGGSL